MVLALSTFNSLFEIHSSLWWGDDENGGNNFQFSFWDSARASRPQAFAYFPAPFNSLFEIRVEKGGDGQPWALELSILFLRFVCELVLYENGTTTKLSILFLRFRSSRDQDLLEGGILLSILFLRFLWIATFAGFLASDTFNSLFEIQGDSMSYPVIDASTFNSLFEIRSRYHFPAERLLLDLLSILFLRFGRLGTRATWRGSTTLSILFLRFTSSSATRSRTRCCAFNSLFEILADIWRAKEAGELQDFQFSFWDSHLHVIWYAYPPDDPFQFSFWDSK